MLPTGLMAFSGQRPAARRAAACAASSKRVVERRELARRAVAGPWRSASPRTRRSWAAAGRAGRCRRRSRGRHRGRPRNPSGRRCRDRLRTRPSGRSAAPSRVRPPWFSKPARTLGAPLEIDLDRDVADQPRAVLAHGLEVDEADAGQLLAAELVGVAEQLVAAADGEDHLAALGRRVQRVALDVARSSAHSTWSRSWPPPM